MPGFCRIWNSLLGSILTFFSSKTHQSPGASESQPILLKFCHFGAYLAKKRDKKCAIFLFWVHFFAVFLFIWVYFYQYFFKFICLKNKNDFLWQLKKKLIFFKFSYSFLWNGCGIFIIQFRIANYPKMFLFYPKILKTSEKNHFQKNRNCAPVEALCPPYVNRKKTVFFLTTALKAAVKNEFTDQRMVLVKTDMYDLLTLKNIFISLLIIRHCNTLCGFLSCSTSAPLVSGIQPQ